MSNRAEEPLDVIVVGAGVIGLACAWRIAQRGLRVRVLERAEPGAGASGVAAGMLAPVGEASWGEEALLSMALASQATWPGFAKELADAGADPGYARLGALHVALDRDEASELERRFELMRKHGLEAEWLRPGEVRRLEAGLAPSAGAAISAPHEAAVDPVRLLTALSAAATSSGAEVLTGADVDGAVIESDRLAGVLTTDGTEHSAEQVVLAAGSWSAAEWLPVEVRPPVRPVKGQVLTLGPRGAAAVCKRIVATERLYLVPRPDGRLIAGATVEEMGFDTRVTAGAVHELLREAYRAFPDIAELELIQARAGLRPGTPDNVPLVGHGGIDGLILATGHFRNGILLAPLTADGVTALATGDELPDALASAAPARFAREEGVGAR